MLHFCRDQMTQCTGKSFFLLQCFVLKMYHVLLDVVAVDSPVLRWIQRPSLGSIRQSTVQDLDLSAMSVSFRSGELICHMLTIVEQCIWVAITSLSICTRLQLGPSPDLSVCWCVLLSQWLSHTTTAACNGPRLLTMTAPKPSCIGWISSVPSLPLCHSHGLF